MIFLESEDFFFFLSIEDFWKVWIFLRKLESEERN